MSVTFKIVFSEDNIRRIKFLSLPSFDEFNAKLTETYPTFTDKKFVLKYLDSDNDKIVVTSQIEWEELVAQLGSENVLKVYIEYVSEEKKEEKSEKCCEDFEKCCGEGKEPNFFETIIENVVKELPQMTENMMQDCNTQWQQHCGNWKEQFGNWQQECSNWKENLQEQCGNWKEQCGNLKEQCGNWGNNGWQEMNQKFWTLHRLSLTYLESLDMTVVQKGKEVILRMLEIIPNHKIALYNLACAESLLGNVKEAVAALEKAINAGYSDLTHMINDSDLTNIKETVGFSNLVERLKLRLAPEPEKKSEEPIVEEKVEEKKEEKVEEKIEVTNNFSEEKLNILAEIFPLPKDILQELLTQCQGSVEQVVDLINSTTFK